MMFMRKIMPMAHDTKKTSVDHDIIHGEYASILKMNVMTYGEIKMTLHYGVN
jgi:hypothetical protein